MRTAKLLVAGRLIVPVSRRLSVFGFWWLVVGGGEAVQASSQTLSGPSNPAEVRRFADGMVPADLRRFHVPGAVFVVVQGDRVVLARGYGYANLARRTPVVPDRTIFRLCSVSKLFTATAVLQLAEEEKIRLNADVNRYLRLFQLPHAFAQPVTPAELLTHTAGFDDLHIGRTTLDPRGLQPLGPFLKQRLPPRVLPPSRTYSYSDFGYTLAGYLVEAISGVPFARYIQRHIFQPLGMGHSSFQQPLPGNLRADLATGYDVDDAGKALPAPVEYFNTAPAAAMLATGADVARFIIAQLNGGQITPPAPRPVAVGTGPSAGPPRSASGAILSTSMLAAMQKSHFSSYPPGYQTPSVAYGFDVEYWNGQRLLLQSGALRGFTSLLVLLPNRKTGFFIAGNTARDAYLFDLERRFLDHFYPSRWPVTRLHTPPSLRGGLDRFTGSYWSNEYSRSTIEKLRQLVNQVQVTSAGNGTLFAHFWDGSTRRLTRLGPLLFGRIDDRNVSYWAFREDRSGRITGMAPGSNEVYDRIQWYETTRVQIIFIVVLALIFLSGAVLWLFVPLVGIALQTYPVHHRMRRGELHSSVVRGQRTNRVPSGCRPYDAPTEAVAQRRWSSESLAGWLLGLNNGLNLFFLVALLVVMLNAVSTQSLHYSWIEYGVPPGVVALLCLPLMTSALAILSAFATVLAWKSRYWSWPYRLHYSAATLGALAFIPFLHYWNLLGFHF